MRKWEQNAVFEYSEYICLVKRINGIVAQKTLVTELVRCKECRWIRYCETEDLDLYLDCEKPDGGGIPRSEEWFCADGERREP